MCGKRFKCKAEIMMHIASKHFFFHVSTCYMCGKVFKCKAELMIHIASKHHNFDYALVICVEKVSNLKVKS